MSIVFYSNNNVQTLVGSGLGVCFGQCTFYAKISKERDCVKTDASSIESNGTAAQALFLHYHSNYNQSRNSIFNLNGLTAGQRTDLAFTAQTLAAALIAGNMGDTVFIDVHIPIIVNGAAQIVEHVVAARLKDHGCLEYFDPNEGLFRESSDNDFSNAINANFTKFNYSAFSYYPVT